MILTMYDVKCAEDRILTMSFYSRMCLADNVRHARNYSLGWKPMTG